MQELEKATADKVNQWLNGNYDSQTKKEIQDLIDNKSFPDLTDAFYRDLEFGTGGLRGIMGAGSNRVNKYTIGAATQGLANYLKNKYPNEPYYNPMTMESSAKNIFLAGVICGGMHTHIWFIENSRVHAEMIMNEINVREKNLIYSINK